MSIRFFKQALLHTMDYKDLQAGASPNSFWFKAKRDLISILMQRACKGKRKLKILNIGAGIGDELGVLQMFGKVYVVDIDKKALDMIDVNLCEEKIIADACDLPYKKNFFDVVVSFDVFEHIEDYKKSVEEAYRVMKPGGSLVFTVPAHQFLFSSHDVALEHYRRYSKKQVRVMFKSFTDLNISYWNSSLFLPMAAVRLATKLSAPKVNHMRLNSFFNGVLYNILLIENLMVRFNMPMPIGLSIVGFCHKQK